MQLGLQYTSQGQKPYNGIFIEGNSIEDWAYAIQSLKIVNATTYIIPNITPNSVSGLLVITASDIDKNETHKHRYVYSSSKNLFLLAHTELNMVLTQEEVQRNFGNVPHFFHPEFGLIPLEKPLDWKTLFEHSNEIKPQVVAPKKGVVIPNNVKHFSVEVEDTDIEKNLLGQDEKPVDVSKLPFDMKKVMKGNAKELEKYMAYLEKHPEAALKLGVPVDMLGTSRGHAFAKFNFKSSFWDRFNFGGGNGSGNSPGGFGSFLGKTSSGDSSVFSLLIYFAIFVFAIALIGRTFSNSSTPNFDPNTLPSITNDDFLRALDSLKTNKGIDSINIESIDKEIGKINLSKKEPEPPEINDNPKNPITDFAFYFVIICIIGFILNLILIEYRRYLISKKQQSDFYNMPDDSSYFDISESETKERKLYFGGNELNTAQKFIVFLIILGILFFLIYPLMKEGRMNTFFLIFYSLLALWFIYILINKHKTFYDGDDE
jgi:hypothetical protein